MARSYSGSEGENDSISGLSVSLIHDVDPSEEALPPLTIDESPIIVPPAKHGVLSNE